MGAIISDLRYENGIEGVTQVVTFKITVENNGVSQNSWSIPASAGFKGFDAAFDLAYRKNDFELIIKKNESKMEFLLDTQTTDNQIEVTVGFITCKPVLISPGIIPGVWFTEELKNRIKKRRIFMEQTYQPMEVKNQRKR